MERRELRRRIIAWLAAVSAAAATLATTQVDCPLSVTHVERIGVDAETPELTRRYVTRTKDRGPGTQVTLRAQQAGEGEPSTVDVWVLEDEPTEELPDHAAQLIVAPGTTTLVSFETNSRFELGFRHLSGAPLQIDVEILAAIDDCSGDRFVRIDRE